MRNYKRLAALAAALLLSALTGIALSEDKTRTSPPSPKENEKKPIVSTTLPVYKPRVGLGAPGGRVGGGTRGGSQTFMLSVLAPNHTGLTMNERPMLYWYLTKPVSAPMEFTLSDDGVKPLIETPLSPPFSAGMQRIRLEDFGVKLTPGKSYRWFVSLIVAPDRRSKDILAGGTIERVDVPEDLAMRVSQAEKRAAPHVYAEAGMWYDAVQAVSELIDADPQDRDLRLVRAALLQQVGLSEIAEAEIATPASPSTALPLQ